MAAASCPENTGFSGSVGWGAVGGWVCSVGSVAGGEKEILPGRTTRPVCMKIMTDAIFGDSFRVKESATPESKRRMIAQATTNAPVRNTFCSIASSFDSVPPTI